VDIWTCKIPAKSSSSVLLYLKEKLPEEPHSLMHLRRLVKLPCDDVEEKNSDSLLLDLLICSVDCLPNQKIVENLIRDAIERFPGIFVVKIEKRQASKYPAYTKEQAVEWSQVSWQIMWRGNPSAINIELSPEECCNSLKYLKQISMMSKQHDPLELPIVTMVVDPVIDKVIVALTDNRRSFGNPIHHSVMQALFEVAKIEADRRRVQSNQSSSISLTTLTNNSSNQIINALSNLRNSERENSPSLIDSKRDRSSSPSSCSSSTTLSFLEEQNYLCLNLHVYSTHEPCPMCAMALVHSRIGRLVYIKSTPKSGAIEPTSGSSYGIHWNKQLNWRYEAWKWQLTDNPNEDDLMIDSVVSIPDSVNA
jgi:tRNA-specific adenosine deaminase 3